jgi:hypothetical protein
MLALSMHLSMSLWLAAQLAPLEGCSIGHRRITVQTLPPNVPMMFFVVMIQFQSCKN